MALMLQQNQNFKVALFETQWIISLNYVNRKNNIWRLLAVEFDFSYNILIILEQTLLISYTSKIC